MTTRDGRQKRPHGSLALQEKCFRALGNIYGSEFLKGDQRLFMEGSDSAVDEAQRGWRRIRDSIWRQPDAYQHIAYMHLYAIKRNHPLFTIGRLTLFMYVAEAVLCFSSAYERLVKATHPRRGSRIGPWAAARLEKAIAWGLLGVVGVTIWDVNSTGEAWPVKAFRISVALAVGSIVAWMVQICGYMRWRECRHLPVWLMVKIIKRLWAFAALAGAHSSEAASRPPSISRGRPVRIAAFRPRVLTAAALMVLFAFSAWHLGLPRLQRVLTAWEVSANSREFIAKGEVFLQQKAASRPTAETIERLTDPKVDVSPIVEVIARVDELLREVKTLLADGQRLVVAGADLDLTETLRAMALVRELRHVEQSLTNLHGQAMKQEQRLRHAEAVERVQSIAAPLAVEAKQRLASRPISLDDKRRDLDVIRDSQRRVEDVLQTTAELKNTSAAVDHSYVERINATRTSMLEVLRQLEGRALRLGSELESATRVAAPPPVLPQAAPRIDPQKAAQESAVARINALKAAVEESLRQPAVGSQDLLALTAGDQMVTAGVAPISGVAARATSPRFPWWEPGRFRMWMLDKDLEYVKVIDEVSSAYAVLLPRLIALEAGAATLQREVASLPELETLGRRLGHRVTEILSYKARIAAFHATVHALDLKAVNAELGRRLQEAKQLDSAQFTYAVMAGGMLLALLILLRIWVAFGNRTGWKKLTEVRRDYVRLLSFLVENRYSLNVNERGAAYLRQIAETDHQVVEEISAGAERRLRKPGELNHRVGLLLREVATGIDNVLNREPRRRVTRDGTDRRDPPSAP